MTTHRSRFARWSAGTALLASTSALFAACGGETAGEAIRPKDPTAAAAMGGGKGLTCEPGRYAEPLAVDLPATDRVDFEAAMNEGVAIVAYDCASGIRLLKDCRLPGDYAFAGVSRKEQVISLASQDEFRANLPFSQGSVGGAIEADKQLDIALVMVGKQATAAAVQRPTLVGSECGDATHYVRAAVLGAWAMQTSTKGSVAVAAKVFSFGAEAGSESAKASDQRDGDLASCMESSPTDEDPPEQCRSAIRFELVPIPDALAEKGDKKEAKPVEDPCPAGFKFVDGKCAESADGPHLCDPQSTAECTQMCDAGDVASCFNLAELAFASYCFDPTEQAKCDAADDPKIEAKFEVEAVALWKKACDASMAEACYNYGEFATDDRPGQKADVPGANEALKKACDLGNADACWSLASYTFDGERGLEQDDIQGLTYQKRACTLGDMYSCLELAEFYFKGAHVAKDSKKGKKILDDYCEQGVSEACLDLGLHLLGRFDDYDAKDKPLADVSDARTKGLSALGRACELDESEACIVRGRSHMDAGEFDRAREWLGKVCEQGEDSNDPEACGLLGQLLIDGKGGDMDKEAGVELLLESSDEDLTMKAIGMIERGMGVKKDVERAKALYEKYCSEWEHEPACAAAKRLK